MTEQEAAELAKAIEPLLPDGWWMRGIRNIPGYTDGAAHWYVDVVHERRKRVYVLNCRQAWLATQRVIAERTELERVLDGLHGKAREEQAE